MAEQKTAKTSCIYCGSRFNVPQDYIGQRAICKNCGEPFDMTVWSAENDYPLIGRLAIKYQFIKEKQLRKLLSNLVITDDDEVLEQALVAGGLMPPEQFSLLQTVCVYLETRRQGRQFGKIAMEKGFCTRRQFDAAIAAQTKIFQKDQTIKRISDLLVESKALTKKQLGAIVSEQQQLEIAGPVSPEEVRNPDGDGGKQQEPIEIVVSDNRLSAHVLIKGGAGDRTTVEAILKYIEAVGITHGVVDKKRIVAYLSQKPLPKTPLKIAKGTLPEPGTKDAVTFFVAVKHSPEGETPVETPGGKNREISSRLKPGDIIAEIIPGDPGKPGTDVFGKPVPPTDSAQNRLTCGVGAKFSKSGSEIVSTAQGYPYLSIDGEISVLPELKISGDVDRSVGDIYFGGGIVVSGTIKKGIRITGASLVAKEIRDSQIDVRGHVDVERGVFGARITAQKDIRASFIKGSEIVSHGNLIVEKEIIDSDVLISGECNIRNGKIVSSTVSARQGIVVEDIGTRLANDSTLMPGADGHVEAQRDRIHNVVTDRLKHLEMLESELAELNIQHGRLKKKTVEWKRIQDQVRSDRHSLLEQIESATDDGDAESLAQAKKTLGKLESRAKEAEEYLRALTKKQKKTSEEIDTVTKESERARNKTDKIQAILAKLDQWLTLHKRVPVVKVFGTIAEGTILAGRRTTKVLKESFEDVEIKEIITKVPSPDDRWEISVLREHRP
jgi:uncharacterized protein (DUF342 family)